MGALLRTCAPAEIVAALIQGRAPMSGTVPDGFGRPGADGGEPGMDSGAPTGDGSAPGEPVLPGLAGLAGSPGPPGLTRLDRALRLWAARLGEAPAAPALEAWRRGGIRLVCPGDPEWPGQLDVLGDACPWGLWVWGSGDLRYACLRSVSIVGTRAATAYGSYVCTEMAVALAERGWTVISGGAFGIDGCAHRGAVGTDGVTIAVLACGVDRDYPQGHHGLFRTIRAKGATVSEWPPGRMPTRPGFLVRNRVIAASLGVQNGHSMAKQ